eukprot:TRINITY_DN4415_c0_g1_i4.p1 TRINITY_DN4415_c0_g1~~TRINITY_DN4415_c0_g1_i4.p1  ORF type:complete len:688 (-),score=106.08 TRINITY_DN4415_c0_g1_i4:16-2079(-)
MKRPRRSTTQKQVSYSEQVHSDEEQPAPAKKKNKVGGSKKSELVQVQMTEGEINQQAEQKENSGKGRQSKRTTVNVRVNDSSVKEQDECSMQMDSFDTGEDAQVDEEELNGQDDGYFAQKLSEIIPLEELVQNVITGQPKTYRQIYLLIKEIQGKELQPGTQLVKLKGYPNALKKKLFHTKSCHQCQNQHVYWQCPGFRENDSKPCQASFCLECLNNWYQGLLVEVCLKLGCPKCQEICNCRACLRKIKLDVLEFDPESQFQCRKRMEQFLVPNLMRSLCQEAQGLFWVVPPPTENQISEEKLNNQNIGQSQLESSMEIQCNEQGRDVDEKQIDVNGIDAQVMEEDVGTNQSGYNVDKELQGVGKDLLRNIRNVQDSDNVDEDLQHDSGDEVQQCITWMLETLENIPTIDFSNIKMCESKEAEIREMVDGKDEMNSIDFDTKLSLEVEENSNGKQDQNLQKNYDMSLEKQGFRITNGGSILQDWELKKWRDWIEAMKQLPLEIDEARALCDRCGTSLNLVSSICSKCEKEVCCGCLSKFGEEWYKCGFCGDGRLQWIRLVSDDVLDATLEFMESSKQVILGGGCGQSQAGMDWINSGRCRLVSNREEGQNHLLLQDFQEIQFESDCRQERLQEFQARWVLGEPLLVTGIVSKINWEPEARERSMRAMGNINLKSERVMSLSVLDCST